MSTEQKLKPRDYLATAAVIVFVAWIMHSCTNKDTESVVNSPQTSAASPNSNETIEGIFICEDRRGTGAETPFATALIFVYERFQENQNPDQILREDISSAEYRDFCFLSPTQPMPVSYFLESNPNIIAEYNSGGVLVRISPTVVQGLIIRKQ